MKKAIFSVSLLLIMLIAAFINIRCLNTLTHEMKSVVAESVEAAEASDWENAEAAAKRAENAWNAKDGYTHVVLRHNEIDTVSDALYDFISCINEHDAKTSAAAAEKVIYHLDSIYRMEQIRFGSIF